jgi:PAS domain S-box-containing protein
MCIRDRLINRDLRKSEQKFRRIFSTAVEGIWILDADLRTSIVNYRVAEILGYSIEEFDDRLMTDFMFEEDISDHLRIMQNQRQDMPESYECRFRRKDGKTVWAIISAAPDFDDEDHFSGSFVMLTDITGRKQAEIERATNLHFLESMDRVNRAIAGTNDLNQMMSDVLDVVLSIFNCDRAFLLYPCDPDTPTWTVPMERTRPEYPGAEALGIEMPIDPDVAATFSVLLSSNGPVKFGPESEYPLPTDVAERFNLKSFIGMALYPKVGKPWEFGLHQCSYRRVWSGEEAKLFQEIGRRLTDALSSFLIYRNLKESEQRFLDIFDNSLDVLYLLEVTEDMHFRNIEVNPAFERSTGLSREQVIGKLQEEVVPKETADAVNAKYRRCAEAGETIEEEVWLDVPSGKQYYHSTLIPARDETGRIYRIVGITRDITEQALAKETIEKSEQKYRQLFEESFDGVFITSPEGRFLEANRRAIEILGYDSIDEMITLDIPRDVVVRPIDRELGLKKINEFGQGEFETIAVKKNGEEIIVRISAVAARDKNGNVTCYRGIIRNITEQHKAAEEIKESRKQVLDILESVTDGFFALDDDWRFTYINRRVEQLFGIKRENLLYRNIWRMLSEEDAPDTFEQFNLARKHMKPLVHEEFIPKIGKWLEFHVHSYEKGLSVYIHDITERKQAEIEQQRLNRELRAIRRCEQALLQAEDEQVLLDDICRIVAEEAGYRLAWVGYVEHDEAKTIRPVSWAGLTRDYVENAKLSWAEDNEHGRGPSGIVARSGKTVYVKDYVTDPLVLPWRENALRHGFRSAVALPLKDENKQVFGVFQVYAGNLDAMNEEEIRLLEELANDLAFGIIMLRGRVERENTEEALRISEERYRKAEAMGHVGNWEYNLQTTECWCSDETKRIFGLDPKQPFFSIGDIAGCISERSRIRRAFTDLAKEGKPYNVKFAIIPKNSSEPRIITSIGELHRDEYGSPLKIVGIIQDITDLKKTETELLSHLYLLNSLDRINKAMHEKKDLDEMMGNVLDEVLSIFDCDRAYMIYPCDPESPVWSVPMERTKPEYPGIFSQGAEVKTDKNVIDTFKILLDSDTPVRFGPESEVPLPVGVEDRFDVKSMMAMAIRPKAGKPWQFGLHQCSYSRVWTQDEEKLFNEIGMRIVDGLAILQMHHGYRNGILSGIVVD